ncbi:MAG: NADH-quinone oxidoreductase subunit NuoG [Nevskiaceae bacterium]|jgi:NADH-quinone oxidoreductase subunit G|nr:NADH-quinone oxidoreductase subunit NuoG [Nevskiaceae bacterium]
MSAIAPDNTVTITVDGVPMKARKGDMLIRVTDANNVYVPRFCYHEKLPVAANCRMCLVEVEKAPKPLPACATPVAEGMVVHTRSVKAIAAQKSVMEFLLINHPLDCPICDQGGECELQDLAVGYGRDVSRYNERKRVVKDKNIGPLVSTDMTRCIHCTRCVRFGQDVAGIQELGTTNRGEHNEIGTYVERSVDHELSGNIIDLCPVGALNSKPFRYSARAWEMTQAPLVSPHDGLGTNVYGHVLRGRLMRVVSRRNDAINECWIADRDRFSYEGIYSADRLLAPRVREADGSWKEVEWGTALEATVQGFKAAAVVLSGVVAGASSTVEEYALLAKLAGALGITNIDHRLRQVDFSGDAQGVQPPSLGGAIADVDSLQALLVVGAHLRREIPVLAHRVRKAAMAGASVWFLNPAEFEHLFPVAGTIVAPPAQQLAELNALVVAAGGKPVGDAAAVTDHHRAMVEKLRGSERKAIWLGALAQRHPQFGALRAAAAALAEATGAQLGVLAEGGNAQGAWLAGCVPHAPGRAAGLNAAQMLSAPLDALLLWDAEPWADSLQTSALYALRGTKFVVAATPFASPELLEVAHVLLPIGTFAETSGTYVNLEGLWQSFAGAVQPVGQARPGWKVLRVLGNLFGLEGFEHLSSEQVRDELKALLARGSAPHTNGAGNVMVAPVSNMRVVDVPSYQIDAILRRATALQKTKEGRSAAVTYGAGARS